MLGGGWKKGAGYNNTKIRQRTVLKQNINNKLDDVSTKWLLGKDSTVVVAVVK